MDKNLSLPLHLKLVLYSQEHTIQKNIPILKTGMFSTSGVDIK